MDRSRASCPECGRPRTGRPSKSTSPRGIGRSGTGPEAPSDRAVDGGPHAMRGARSFWAPPGGSPRAGRRFSFDRGSTPASQPLSDETPRIGPYRLLQVLGEGGMGVVYEAEQVEPVRRRVALKVLQTGLDSKNF